MNFIKSINLKYTKKVTGASDGIGWYIFNFKNFQFFVIIFLIEKK